jgi:hypothetical protein
MIENITAIPTFYAGPHYRSMFDTLYLAGGIPAIVGFFRHQHISHRDINLAAIVPEKTHTRRNTENPERFLGKTLGT